MDGGRIFVPLPEQETENNKIKYYWKKHSLQFKVGRVIGHYYIYDSLEGVARQSKIEIRD